MKLNRFFDILSNVHSVKEEEITDLQQITHIYPFFQAAQILYAKALHNANHYTFQNDIKKIAAVVYDRKQLFQVLYQEDQADLIDINELKNETVELNDDKILDFRADNKDEKEEIKSFSHFEPKSENNETAITKETAKSIKPDIIVSETIKESADKSKNDSSSESTIWKNEDKTMFSFEIPQKSEEIPHDQPNTDTSERASFLNQATDSDLYQNEIAKAMVTAFAEKDILEVNKIDEPKQQSQDVKAEEELEPVSEQEKVDILENHSSFANWLKQINGSKTEDKVPSTSKIEEKKPNEVPIIETNLKQPELKKEETETEELPDLEKLKKSRLVKEHQEIIDKIIKIEPKITKPRSEFFNSANKAKDSVQEDDSIVSETLARIYAMQGNLNKAIKTYEILSLKFPEKSAYFAALIKELKINSK